ncbi:MAG: DMT family transporter [Proteobacteria bacterium]|nr:DMT family transporter [Pseudomonadota bacterium]
MRLSEYRHVLLCALCYGSAVVLARFAFEDGSNAATVVSVRCAFAALAIGVALRIDGSERHTSGRERALLLGLGLVFALGVFSFYKAIEILRVPLAILVFYVNPLVIGVFGAMAGFERMTGRVLLYALLSLVGLALATGASPDAVDAAGIGYAILAAALTSAVLVVSTHRLSHVDAKSRTFWMMLTTSAAVATATVAGDAIMWPRSALGLWAVAGVCVLYAIGLVALFTSAVRIGPLRTGLVMNIEPIIAIGGSWLLLGQGLTPLQLCGGGLVIAGVIGAQMNRRPASPAR